MFLVKCQCGCFYTLKEDKLEYPGPPNATRTCPNCGVVHNFDDGLKATTMMLPDINIKRIPDDAKFSVTFDPSI